MRQLGLTTVCTVSLAELVKPAFLVALLQPVVCVCASPLNPFRPPPPSTNVLLHTTAASALPRRFPLPNTANTTTVPLNPQTNSYFFPQPPGGSRLQVVGGHQ